MSAQAVQDFIAAAQAFAAAEEAELTVLQSENASLQEQLDEAEGRPFLHVTIIPADGETPAKARLEFFNGAVAEKDFPTEGSVDFNIDVGEVQ